MKISTDSSIPPLRGLFPVSSAVRAQWEAKGWPGWRGAAGLLVVLCLLAGQAAAQPSPSRYWEAAPASLRRVLAGQHADTARLRTLMHLADVNGWDDRLFYDERIAAELREAVALTARLRRPEHGAYVQMLASLHGSTRGHPTREGLDSLQAAIRSFDRLGHPVPWLVANDFVTGALHRQGDEVFRTHFQTKLNDYRMRGDSTSMAVCCHALGGYYSGRGDYNRAIGYYLQAARLYHSFHSYSYYNCVGLVGTRYAAWGNNAKALHYLNLALSPRGRRFAGIFQYTCLARAYLDRGDYPAALRAADQALAIGTADAQAGTLSYNTRSYIATLVLKSEGLLRLRRPAEAAPLLRQAQQMADAVALPLSDNEVGDVELDATWARYYAACGDAPRAEAAWRTAYQKSRQGSSAQLRLAYLRELARFYQGHGQTGLCARYALAAVGLADTLSAAQGALHVAQYETEAADRAQTARIAQLRESQLLEAARARRQRLLLGSVLAVLALIGGFSFVLWRGNRQKQRVNDQLHQLHQAVTVQKGELEAQRDQLNASLTELRATQAQLIQKEKMASLGELTAGIAHEIQNPLNFVNNFSEVSTELMAELEEAQATGDTAEATALAADVRQNLSKITAHGQRAAAIVRGMLEHSRASTGERQLTDLNQLAEEYLRLAYQGLRAKDKSFNAALSTDFGADVPEVRMVGADVGRVLLNLFTNAFYAVRQRQQVGEPGYQPQVGVATSRVNGHVLIRVADNGPGMSPAVQAKIFQPFFTTKPPGDGTGLGLSLSHDIIAQGHGGTLSVESQEGQGTTFCVALPLNGAGH